MAKNSLERIMRIDELIRSGCYPSRGRIAEEYEVSVKTIERDLDYLRDRLHAPLVYDRNKLGYYYAREGYFLPSMFMTEGEAAALLVSQHIGTAWRDTPLADITRKAWDKFRAMLPDEISLNPAVFSETIMLIDQSVRVDPDHWSELLNAARSRYSVRIFYRKPGFAASIERVLHPYRIIHFKDAWYVLGFDEYRSEVRIYAISRIQSVETLPQRKFTIPNEFSISDYIDPEFGIFTEKTWFAVCLKAPADSGESMLEHLPMSNLSMERTGDTMLIRFRTNQHQGLKHWVLQWGKNVEVIEPEILRDDLASIGRYFLETYKT